MEIYISNFILYQHLMSWRVRERRDPYNRNIFVKLLDACKVNPCCRQHDTEVEHDFKSILVDQADP